MRGSHHLRNVALTQNVLIRSVCTYLCVVASTTAFTCTTVYLPVVTSSRPSASLATYGWGFSSLVLEQNNITASIECWTTAPPHVVFHLKLINSSSENVLLNIPQMYVVDQKGRRFSPIEYGEMSLAGLPATYPPLLAERLIPHNSQTGIISVRFDPRQNLSFWTQFWHRDWRVSQATLHFNLIQQTSGQLIPFEATFRRK